MRYLISLLLLLSTSLAYSQGLNPSTFSKRALTNTTAGEWRSALGALASTNGLHMGSFNFQTNGSAVDHFLTVPDYYIIRWGTNGASARWNAAHPGGGELEITSVGSISINPGYGGLGGSALQIGSSGAYHETPNFQYDSEVNPALASYTGPLGHSKLVIFTTKYKTIADATAYSTAGFILRSLDTNGATGFQLWNPAPHWIGGMGTNGTLVGGTLQAETYTNGTRINGMLKRELTTTTGTGTYAIDLETPSFQEFNLTTNSVFTLATVNLTNSVVERDIIIRPGVGDFSLTFPTGWIWLSESGLAVAPTNIVASTIINLRLKALANSGGTNIYARYAVGAYSPVLDSDAAAFFTAASITDGTQKAAVNQLVLQLKAHSLWTKIDALYTFVGGNATAHSYNLKNPATFQITWAGTVTHNGNGITGNGTSGCGDTGYNPNTSGLQNSSHLYVYNRTTLPTGSFMQAVGTTGATRRFGLSASGSTFVMAGLGIDDQTSGLNLGSNFRGHLMGSRTGSTTQSIYATSTSSAGVATATTGKTTKTVGILCRNFEGFPADTFSTANLAAASIGSGMTGSEVTQYFADMLEFQTTLGRQ